MKIKKTFPVVGMSCASCAARIDKVIHEQPGVCEANINYATAQAQVVYDTEICSVQALKNAVQDAGYDLLTETDQQGEEKAKQIQNEKYRLLKIQTFGVIIATDHGHQYGVCEYSLHELCFMVPFDLCRFRFRKQILPQCLAAIETRYFQYGYPGCQQHRYRLSIQCIQSIVPGFLVIAGDNAPFVFRGCKRYYSFYSSGPLTRRTGETKHLNGYP